MRHELWPLSSGLLLFIGLLASNGLLLVVGSLVFVVWLAARVWDRHCFRKVTFDRELGRRRAFIGDSIEYSVSLSNDKPLPLIWVEAQDRFPEGLDLAGAVVRGETLEANRHHSITASLLPYQRATWTFKMRCLRRGYHRIGPVRLRSSDMFGFSSSEVRLAGVNDILVYPRVMALEELVTPPQHPFGLTRGRTPLYHDTNRVRGLREYRPDDPQKHIDWKATARTLQLQTRVFEPSVSMSLLIALNGSTSDFVWQGTNRRLFERAVTAAASAAALADSRGYSYGLLSNAVASYSGKWLTIPVGASSYQLARVLEALAMASPYVVAMLPEVIQAERDILPAGATVLLVTGAITDSMPEQVREIADRGFQLSILYAGDGEPPESIGGVPVSGAGHLLDALPEDAIEWENEPETVSEVAVASGLES
jgi:uncharacterized protein (DUF58 family)